MTHTWDLTEVTIGYDTDTGYDRGYNNQINQISLIIHQYTKRKNENVPLTHGLTTQEGTFKITT